VLRPDLDHDRTAGLGERILSKTIEALVPAVREGLLIVGIEPSCTAVLRSDAVELLG
jgi:Fe-S oxidoreductase